MLSTSNLTLSKLKAVKARLILQDKCRLASRILDCAEDEYEYREGLMRIVATKSKHHEGPAQEKAEFHRTPGEDKVRGGRSATTVGCESQKAIRDLVHRVKGL